MPLFSLDDHVPNLPESTREVLRCRGRGLTIKQAADELCLSESAVHSRLQRFYDDFDVRGDFVVAWSAGHLCCCLGAARPKGKGEVHHIRR